MQISFVQWSLKCGHQTTKLSCTKWDNCTRLHWYICEAYIGRYMGHALMMSPMFRLLACKHLLISLLTWERWMCETIFMVIRPIAAEIFQWDNRNVNLLVMREKARKWSAGFVFWGSRMTSFFFYGNPSNSCWDFIFQSEAKQWTDLTDGYSQSHAGGEAKTATVISEKYFV